MARIILAHTSYEAVGGGEVFGVEVKRALQSLGHRVVHVTLNPGNPREVKRLLGDVSFDEVLPRPLSDRILYHVTRGGMVKLRRLLLAKALLARIGELREKYGADLVVDTSSGYPIPLDIVYLHQPTILALKRSRSLPARLYLYIIMRVGRGVLGNPRIPLTNSRYTAGLLREIYPFLREVRVLHPPVDYKFYSRSRASCRDRAAVTLTRIARVKRIDALLEVASRAPDWSIHVIGAATTRQSVRYAGWLEREARRRGLGNFHIHLNLTRAEILEYFSRACAYIHPPFHEFFGIAVAEAMSAGLPPIVWREGGAWTDLVSPCCPSLGYRDPEEIPGKLEEAHRHFAEYSERARITASRFSHENFREKLAEIINRALEEGPP